MKHMRSVIGKPVGLLLCFLFVFTSLVFARQGGLTVTGRVTDVANGEPLEFARVELRTPGDHRLVASSAVAADGSYSIRVPAAGRYYLKATFMGYDPAFERDLALEEGRRYTYSFSLAEKVVTLNEVVVKGLSEGERVQRMAYNMSMLETGQLKHTTLDLAHALDRISGVKIRENGGPGADVNISLNGHYNFGSSYAADTAARKYNWLGEWKTMPNRGESSYMKYRYRDRNGAGNLRVTLFPADHHSLSFSTTLTSFSRKGTAETTLPHGEDDYPKESRKTVSGLSYKYDFRGVWNTSLFVKNYLNHLEAYVDPDGEFGPETVSSTRTPVPIGAADWPLPYSWASTCS